MTQEEKIICKIFLEDECKDKSCNEYKLLMDLVEAQPCEDAISRQAYIERFRKWAYSEFGRKMDNEALAIRVAMSLPPVTPSISKDDMLKIDGLREDAYKRGYEQARYDYEADPCEDAVSREEAIKAAMQDVSDKRTHDFNAGATRAANRIKLLPPVTPK